MGEGKGNPKGGRGTLSPQTIVFQPTRLLEVPAGVKIPSDVVFRTRSSSGRLARQLPQVQLCPSGQL
jgi:hypothetical protein